MKLVKQCLTLWAYFCLATIVAEAGVVAVLLQRGQLKPHLAEHLLTVAYDVPVADIYDRLSTKAGPEKKEMVSFEEFQESYWDASLNLDLREMSSDKGLVDLRELDVLLEQEESRYTAMKEEFDRQWEAIRLGATGTELLELRRQIEAVNPKIAKDQLLRILDDPELDASSARQQVVTIFKSIPIDKRKKIIKEFKDEDATRLNDILREIRLGMPEVKLIRDTRAWLEEFYSRK